MCEAAPGTHGEGCGPSAQHVGHEGPRVAMQPPGGQHHQVKQPSHCQAHVEVQELRLVQHANVCSFLHPPLHLLGANKHDLLLYVCGRCLQKAAQSCSPFQFEELCAA